MIADNRFMAIRFSFDGVQFEVDSPGEAVALQRALRDQGRVQPNQNAPTENFRRVANAVALAGEHPADVVFRNGHDVAIRALLEEPEGVDTGVLAALMGKPSAKSIPPTIAAWNQRAKTIGLDMGKLLEMKPGFDGQKTTTKYRLTDEGRRVFGQEKIEWPK
jgi:hypothetical protein